jgi:hypothetical protein
MKFVDKNDAKDAGHFQSVRHLLHHLAVISVRAYHF